MGNHFKVKLINFGLIFANYNIRIVVQDMKLPQKSIPIVLNHTFKAWSGSDLDLPIGKADLYTENFDLFADCYFDKDIMLAQPTHDRIVIRVPRNGVWSFNAFSMLLSHMVYANHEVTNISPTKIISSIIEDISLVPYGADPGIFIFEEPSNKINPDRAIIFLGQVVDKFILD